MSSPFYWSKEWKQVRKEVLTCHPYCQREGCSEIASRVDHLTPIAEGGAKLDPGNLIALCPPCHNQKTALRDGGFGRAKNPNRVLPGSGEDGRPLDPGHHWNKRA